MGVGWGESEGLDYDLGPDAILCVPVPALLSSPDYDSCCLQEGHVCAEGIILHLQLHP